MLNIGPTVMVYVIRFIFETTDAEPDPHYQGSGKPGLISIKLTKWMWLLIYDI